MILNSHTFLAVNGALAVSYVLARLMTGMPIIRRAFTQADKLRFIRCAFAFAVMATLAIPFITVRFQLHTLNTVIQPVLLHASASFLKHHDSVAAQVAAVNTVPMIISVPDIIFILWLAGCAVFLGRYLNTLRRLRQVFGGSARHHDIGRIHVFFSDKIDAPFCWSVLHAYYIALPDHAASDQQNLRLAIRHEFQHIRQHDTHWLHLMHLARTFCWWNPFLKFWSDWMNEIQEFACDEALILSRQTSPLHYAQCLLDTAKSLAPAGVIGINGASTSILYRRVTMIFKYKKRAGKAVMLAAYTASFLAITSAAFAFDSHDAAALNYGNVAGMIKSENLASSALHVQATPETVSMLNQIRGNPQEKQKMLAALERMKQYQSYIQAELRKNHMPAELIALPLVESGFKPLPESANAMKAAGIWQFIPATARNMGLTVNASRDDRLDTQLSTQAAITYLSTLYKEFHDWRLAVTAYEIGEQETERLIRATGSRDAWKITRSAAVPQKYKQELKYYQAMMDASLLIIHKPELLQD